MAPTTQNEARADENPEEKPVASNPSVDEQAAAEPPRVLRHDLLQQERIAVQALGASIEAIVIKNPNNLRSARESLPMLDEALSHGTPLRLNDIMRNKDEPVADVSESWKHIDDLRPGDATILRKRDVNKLISTLVDGFTRDQLVSYANRQVQEQPDETPSYPWIVKQEPWKAAQGVQMEGLTPKKQLALLILKKRWKIEVQEQVESLGKMRVWLQPEVFHLISRTPSRFLRDLAAKYLDGDNDEKIVPDSEESQLVIYSRKSTVSTILARIDATARSLTSKTVSVKPVGNDSLSEAVLAELERVTHTCIRYIKKTEELCVSWFADSKQRDPDAVPTEDPADVALRLLLELRVLKPARQVQMLAPMADVQYKKPAHVEYHRERKSMSWIDKLRPWSRYVSPIAKSPHAGPPLDFPANVVLPGSTFDRPGPRTANRLTATFGHVLHGKPTIRVTGVAKCRRILSPVVPHPASLTSVAAGDQPVSQSTTIHLNFCPEPAFLNFIGDATARHLRLRLPVHPDSDLSALSLPPDAALEAAFAVQVNDILLPEESVDVRLVQEHLHPLDINQQPLQHFLAASEFNLLKGRLRTPSRLLLSVPTAWLSDSAPASLKAKSSVDAPYMFMGLEVHQVVDMDWHGHTLRYSSIDAGHHGGQRQEISLHTSVPSGPHPMTARMHIGDFLRLVEEVATGKHFSWHEGYKLVQPRSKESLDLDWDTMDDEPLQLDDAQTWQEPVPASSARDGPSDASDILGTEPTPPRRPDTAAAADADGDGAPSGEPAAAEGPALQETSDDPEAGHTASSAEDASSPSQPSSV